MSVSKKNSQKSNQIKNSVVAHHQRLSMKLQSIWSEYIFVVLFFILFPEWNWWNIKTNIDLSCTDCCVCNGNKLNAQLHHWTPGKVYSPQMWSSAFGCMWHKKKNEKNWNRCWTHRQWLCIRYWNRRTSRENHAARNCTMVQINENTHIIQGGAVPLVYKGSFTAYDFEFRVQTQSRDLDQDLFPLWMHNITCLRGTIRRVRKDDMPSYLWNVGCILTSWATSLNLF